MPCTCADGTLILAEEVLRNQSTFWLYTIISDPDERRREICMQTEDPIAEEVAKMISEETAPEEQVKLIKLPENSYISYRLTIPSTSFTLSSSSS